MRHIFLLGIILFGFCNGDIHSKMKSGRLEIQQDLQQQYPFYIKQLATSMDALLKGQHLYLAYVANANTPGYRRMDIANIRKKGKIVPVMYFNWEQGTPRDSVRPLDCFLEGANSFFTVEMPDGTIGYTKDGRLHLNPDGELVTLAHQLPVLGNNGKIYLEGDNVHISKFGEIFYQGKIVDEIKVTTFQSLEGLWGHNATVFFVSDPNKSPILDEDRYYKVKQGFYEYSNADILKLPNNMYKNFMEGTAKTAKLIFDSYDQMYRVVGPE